MSTTWKDDEHGFAARGPYRVIADRGNRWLVTHIVDGQPLLVADATSYAEAKRIVDNLLDGVKADAGSS